MNKYEETLKVAEFAEKELKILLSDVELQSEKLISIQQKAGKAREGMYKTDLLMTHIARFNKSRAAVGFFFILVVISVVFYFKLKL